MRVVISLPAAFPRFDSNPITSTRVAQRSVPGTPESEFSRALRFPLALLVQQAQLALDPADGATEGRKVQGHGNDQSRRHGQA